METLRQLFDFVLHLNVHLDQLVAEYGVWVYAIMFVIVFCETGLVFTPFLPGDSLLFAAGALAASGRLNVALLVGLLTVAAILGDSVNYWIGRTAGEGLQRRFPRLIRRQHLDKTHDFFERYGGKTIVIARFVPIVRTFAPFVAGASRMEYRRFGTFNIIGGILWVFSMTISGYLFGNIPVVEDNFTLVVLAIIALSLVPMAVEWWRGSRARKRARTVAGSSEPNELGP